MPDLPELILASTSPYRQACLRRLGLPFAIRAPQVAESRQLGESPLEMALRLARAKAMAVAATAPQVVVIGGDQVLDVNGRDFGKPGDAGSAIAQLQHLSGRKGIFHCGTCVRHGEREWLHSVPTTVQWRNLSQAEIQAYVTREPSFGSAGAAQLEGLGITLVDSMTSADPSAILGMPLIYLSGILRELGYPLPG